MIRYALTCPDGHRFEAWFRSSEDYDHQAERGIVTCPACGSTGVAKALMAPAVRNADAAPPVVPAETDSLPALPPPAVVNAALASPEGREILAKLKALKARMLENSENVGTRFAEEARKIHYGESPERAVHGQATAEDASALLEEGIAILPVPILPDERN